MSVDFLLDTSVLSETSKARQRQPVVDFLTELKRFYVPAPALVEFQQGIWEVAQTNPVKAVRLSNWFNALVSNHINILYETREVIDVLGTLHGDNRLNSLKIPRADAKRPRCGFDLSIAAIALTHRLPIATFNVKDFLLIDSCYPLPGIYDPGTALWHVKMDPLEFPELTPLEREGVNANA